MASLYLVPRIVCSGSVDYLRTRSEVSFQQICGRILTIATAQEGCLKILLVNNCNTAVCDKEKHLP